MLTVKRSAGVALRGEYEEPTSAHDKHASEWIHPVLEIQGSHFSDFVHFRTDLFDSKC